MQNNHVIMGNEMQTRDMSIRLDEIGWSLFLIMIGTLWLLPSESVPKDTWLLGAGIIMLGLNLARRAYGLAVSGFAVFLGVVAFVAGISGVFDLKIPFIAAVFVVVGLSLLFRAFMK